MYGHEKGKMAQESWPYTLAILRDYIHWYTVYVPIGWFLSIGTVHSEHEIIRRGYRRVCSGTCLGKIERSGCYINNGKYGYFLTCGKKNYKIPIWLEPEEITLDMAKRIIEYKQKISEQWLEKSTNNSNESDAEVDEDTIKSKIKK